MQPVTNQVTTTPGNRRHSATYRDTCIALACGDQVRCDAIRRNRNAWPGERRWHVLLAEPVRLVMTPGSGAAPSLRVGMLSTWRSAGRGGFSLVGGRG